MSRTRVATWGRIAVALLAALAVTGCLPADPMTQAAKVTKTRKVATTTTTAPATQALLSDDFTGPAKVWPQGAAQGPWFVNYHGYGQVGLLGDGTLRLTPRAVTSPDLTSASLATTVQSFTGDLHIEARMRTAKQLRLGSPPNAWEVAWLAWNYTHDHSFYYFIPKPNGWELGKVDDTKRDPNGPACVWPEYRNCFYPGAQRFLATGSSPTFAVGEWHDIRVVQRGSTITASVGGRELVTFTDAERPYRSGTVGLYTEDADIRVDRVLIRRP